LLAEQSNRDGITSHSLCPILHSWSIALTLAGKQQERDFTVRRLLYPDMARWSEFIPAGVELPFLTTGLDHVFGSLPILQWIEETVDGSRLLPEQAVERIRTRNRALVALDLFGVMRGVLVSKTLDEQTVATSALFNMLKKCEALSWSAAPRLDWVLLAAATTILTSQDKIMNDDRWSGLPRLRDQARNISEHPVVMSTKAQNYSVEFSAFFRATGSSYAQ
jgi:hypothetical protein